MWIENKIRMSFFNRIISFIFESTRRKLIGARNQMIFLLLLYWTKFTSTADSTELTDKAANDAASIVRVILLDEIRYQMADCIQWPSYVRSKLFLYWPRSC